MEIHFRIQWLFLRFLARSYFRLSIQGTEHIPATGPVILAANHCSFLDPPLIALGTPRQTTYLAKEELFVNPVMGWWCRWVGVHPVSRKQGDARAVLMVMRFLKEGKVFVIFPEGTRSEDGQLQPLERGFAWIAIQSGAPVIPLYLHGTFAAMPRGKHFPKTGAIWMRYGEPILPEKKQPERIEEQIEEFTQRVTDALQGLRAEVEAEENRRKKISAPLC